MSGVSIHEITRPGFYCDNTITISVVSSELSTTGLMTQLVRASARFMKVIASISSDIYVVVHNFIIMFQLGGQLYIYMQLNSKRDFVIL